jgi:hypothetical protein
MEPFLKNPEDFNSILNGFIEFVNSHTVSGYTMGIGLYQAVYDENENIIDWIKL